MRWTLPEGPYLHDGDIGKYIVIDVEKDLNKAVLFVACHIVV